MAFLFGDMTLDGVRRELRSGSTLLPIEPQVFDLLEFLIRNRERVVSRDDLLAAVWNGRIVSDSAIDARINAARRAIGDDGEQQGWIRTIARKGFRFVGNVREEPGPTLNAPAQRAAQQAPKPGWRAEANLRKHHGSSAIVQVHWASSSVPHTEGRDAVTEHPTVSALSARS